MEALGQVYGFSLGDLKVVRFEYGFDFDRRAIDFSPVVAYTQFRDNVILKIYRKRDRVRVEARWNKNSSISPENLVRFLNAAISGGITYLELSQNMAWMSRILQQTLLNQINTQKQLMKVYSILEKLLVTLSRSKC